MKTESGLYRLNTENYFVYWGNRKDLGSIDSVTSAKGSLANMFLRVIRVEKVSFLARPDIPGKRQMMTLPGCCRIARRAGGSVEWATQRTLHLSRTRVSTQLVFFAMIACRRGLTERASAVQIVSLYACLAFFCFGYTCMV